MVGKNLLSETQVGVLGKCQGIDCFVYEMLLIKRVPNSSFNLYHILDIFLYDTFPFNDLFFFLVLIAEQVCSS